jgi:hypothetical protein
MITKEDLIRLYQNEQKTASEVADILKVGRTTISNYLKKYNIPKHKARKYIPNDNYFESWNHEMAYVLGYLTADGHISKDNPYLYIGLAIKDIEALEYIRNQISPNSKIRISKDGASAYLYIMSEKIIKDLAKYNVTTNKTFNLKLDFNIPDEFFGSYLLGFFDGDGSIFSSNQRGYNYYYCSFIGASKQFILDIKNKIKIGSFRIIDGSYYELKICQSECKILYQIMYSHKPIFCLNRKREKFSLIKEKYFFWTKEENEILKNENDLNKLCKLLPKRSKESIRVRKNKIKRESL